MTSDIDLNLDVPYGFSRRLPGTTLEAARERVTEALRSEGFGVLTEIDVSKTFRVKLGVEFPPYIILGACQPQLAYRALTAEAGVGLLLPCNVVVAQDGDDAWVSAASPHAMFGVIGPAPELSGVVDEAEDRLRRAIEKT